VYKAISLRTCICCHSNKTRAPTANPPNSAQLESTPTVSPSYIRVRARAVVWECSDGQTDRQTHTHTHTHTQTAVAIIHFTSALPHAKCNNYIIHVMYISCRKQRRAIVCLMFCCFQFRVNYRSNYNLSAFGRTFPNPYHHNNFCSLVLTTGM